MFTVESVDDTVARLRANGAELVGEVAQYEDRYRTARPSLESSASKQRSLPVILPLGTPTPSRSKVVSGQLLVVSCR